MDHGDQTAGGASAFDVVLRGYDRRQVDDHLSGLEQRLSATAAQASELRGQRDSAAGRVRELEGGGGRSGSAAPVGLDGFGAHVESILRVATEEAASIRRAAEEAGRRHSEAEEKLRATFQGIAERLEPLVTKLDEESATARTAHSDLEAEVSTLHASARKQADALVAAVEAATARMQSAAEARVEVTARQTADVREELALVRQVLSSLGPDPRTGGVDGGAVNGPTGAPTAPAVAMGKAPAAPSPTGALRAGQRVPIGKGGPPPGSGSDDATGPVPVVPPQNTAQDGGRGRGPAEAPTESIAVPPEFAPASGRVGGAPPAAPGREGGRSGG